MHFKRRVGVILTLVGKVVVVDTVTIDMASVIACVVEADDPVPIVFEGMTKSFVCWDPAVDDVESNSIVVIDWGRIFTVGVDAAVPAVVTFGGSSVEGVCEPCTATLPKHMNEFKRLFAHLCLSDSLYKCMGVCKF